MNLGTTAATAAVLVALPAATAVEHCKPLLWVFLGGDLDAVFRRGTFYVSVGDVMLRYLTRREGLHPFGTVT